ncbi:MAG: thermosome subunit alpha [bacterium]
MTDQPMYVVKDSNPEKPKSPQKQNIQAAKIVADTIKSTLGPKGMDKLLVNSMNEITITNDGVTILDELELQHPIAKMIVEIARTQEDEVGDGTTTAVILAGELLAKAEKLLDRKIHPTIITKGFLLAAEKALSLLQEKATSIDTTDKKQLEQIVKTAMTGKGAEVAKDVLAPIVVEAVLLSKDKRHIAVQKKVGHPIEESSIVKGLILDKTKVHADMPSKCDSAKIALLNCPLEIKDTETDAKITITNPSQMQDFISGEEAMIKKLVDTIVASGANVVFCSKGIDDLAQYFLAKAGILAVRRMKQSDMEKLAQATGAKIVFDVADLSANALGLGDVEEISDDETFIQVSNTKHSTVATIFVSGGTEHVADEAVRAVEDAVGDIFSVLKSKKVVCGAGAIEIALSKDLFTYAKSFPGREQLAVQAFAESLEIVPKTLAENAGLDPIDILTELYAEHDKGNVFTGIDILTGKTMDAKKSGIVEPINVKSQAIQSATEVANMILRIDDVIATSAEPEPQRPQGGPNVSFPPGM